MRFLSRYDNYTNEIKEIIRYFKTNKQVPKKGRVYPEFIIAANVAEAMENLKYPAQETSAMYKLAVSLEESTPAFDLLKFLIRAGMLYSDKKDFMDLKTYYSKVMDTTVPKGTKEIVKDFYDKIIEGTLDPLTLRDFR